MPIKRRMGSLSYLKSSGSKVTSGRTKSGFRYSTVVTKEPGHVRVRTTINQLVRGKMRRVVLYSHRTII